MFGGVIVSERPDSRKTSTVKGGKHLRQLSSTWRTAERKYVLMSALRPDFLA
jgi:DNA-binding sugar fermentation-stimulating protein